MQTFFLGQNGIYSGSRDPRSRLPVASAKDLGQASALPQCLRRPILARGQHPRLLLVRTARLLPGQLQAQRVLARPCDCLTFRPGRSTNTRGNGQIDSRESVGQWAHFVVEWPRVRAPRAGCRESVGARVLHLEANGTQLRRILATQIVRHKCRISCSDIGPRRGCIDANLDVALRRASHGERATCNFEPMDAETPTSLLFVVVWGF